MKLRKQFIKGVKGKLYIKALYIDKNIIIEKLSNSKSTIFNFEIDIKRAVFNAVTYGIKLCVVENGATSSTKLYKILDWGVMYGNDDVKVKTYTIRNKKRVGIWVKGRRGMIKNVKYDKTSDNEIYEISNELGLTNNSEIWKDDF